VFNDALDLGLIAQSGEYRVRRCLKVSKFVLPELMSHWVSFGFADNVLFTQSIGEKDILSRLSYLGDIQCFPRSFRSLLVHYGPQSKKGLLSAN
jgi:hypothetical protein